MFSSISSRLSLITFISASLLIGCGDDDTTTSGATSGSGGGGGSGINLSEVTLRFANLAPGGDAVAPCLRVGGSGDFTGPLSSPLSPGASSEPVTLDVDGGAEVRWVTGTDCAASGVDADVALVFTASRNGVALRMPGDGSGSSPNTTRIVHEHDLEEISPTRFYARFFHSAPGVGDVSLKQNDCALPISAFEQTAYGELGYAPNNDDDVFHISVSTGETGYTTNVLVCDSSNNELLRLDDFTFNGGEVLFTSVSGDGSAASPIRFTTCVEGGSDACTVLP